MRYTFTLLLTILFYSNSFAQCDTTWQYTCPAYDTCTNWEVDAILRPTRDIATGINTWSFINDSEHKSRNCSTVVANASGIKVYFNHKAHKILSYIAAPDESMIAAAQVKMTATDPFYGEGGYLIGSRVFRDYAEIYMGKIARLAWYMLRDSASNTWSIGAYNPVGISMISPAISWTNHTDYIEINTANVIGSKGAPTFYIPMSNGDPKYILDVRPSIISPTHYKLYITKAGVKVNIVNLPQYTRILIDYGEQCVPVNPLTEKFSISANIWTHGELIGCRP